MALERNELEAAAASLVAVVAVSIVEGPAVAEVLLYQPEGPAVAEALLYQPEGPAVETLLEQVAAAGWA